MAATILLVEDNAEHSRLIAESLRDSEDACRVIAVATADSALRTLCEYPIDCALLDYSLPDTKDLECLERMRARHPELPVIIVTGLGSEEVAVRAMKLGATDYLVKHGRYLRQVARLVHDALGHVDQSGAPSAAAPSSGALDPTAGLLGVSTAMQEVRRLIRAAGRHDATVLIEGETGTGKELVARAVHDCSTRRGRPFVAVNCAAIPESLLENELFGHTQGAFTNAHRDRPGLFHAAHGGTLFLDEVSDLPALLQPKLLRVLESGAYRALGSTCEQVVDVRLIAACNRRLRPLVESGGFRADLYYRLHVLAIRIPPLRDRLDDIPVLARHFLRKHGASASLNDVATAQLLRARWPGNVRELEHAVQRTLLCGAPEVIDAFAIDDEPSMPDPQRDERAQLVRLLALHHGDLATVARALDVSVRTLQRRMVRHSLRALRFRGDRAAS